MCGLSTFRSSRLFDQRFGLVQREFSNAPFHFVEFRLTTGKEGCAFLKQRHRGFQVQPAAFQLTHDGFQSQHGFVVGGVCFSHVLSSFRSTFVTSAVAAPSAKWKVMA